MSQRFFDPQYKIDLLKKKNATIDLENYYTLQYQIDSTKKEIIFNLAFYQFQNKKYTEAKRLLKKIIKNPKYSTPENYFLLGQCSKFEGDYLTAKENFKEGLSKSKKLKDRNRITKFNREIESVEWAIENSKNQLNNLEIKNNQIFSLQSSYATGLDETNQFIILDELDSLGLNLVYLQDYNNNKITKIKRDSSIILIGSISKVPNSNRIYFSNCDLNKKCKLSTGELINFEIINIKDLKGFTREDSATYTMPFYSEIDNKNHLFYVSNNNFSKGGLDIFLGELCNYDSIISSKNLTNINTITDEVSPFYDKNSKTIYFSNNYYNGFGGLDIFKTKFINGKTSKIENVGKPFNSSYNDLYYTYNDSISTVTSNRNKERNCCNSIYSFKNKKNINQINIFQDSIQNDHSREIKKDIQVKMKKLFPITLYFHNDIPNPKSYDSITNLNYENTYLEYKKLKNLYVKKNDNEIDKIKISQFFDSTISTGYEDLKSLMVLLSKEIKNGTTFKIIIKGYASPLASNKYNINLSKRRINSILNLINEFQNGELKIYLNKNIFIEEKHFGEEKSNKQVNDDPKNKKKSIYSLDAALERKIELVDILIE